MKTAISVPDQVFRKAERVAKQRKLSRSALFTQALSEFLEKHGREDVTERLNLVYGSTDSAVDQVTQTLQSLSLPKEKW